MRIDGVHEFNQNLFKGLLILFVVLDHNDYIKEIFPGYFLALSLHVVGFLSLPLFRYAKPLSIVVWRDIFIRYYTPYTVILIAVGIVYLHNLNQLNSNHIGLFLKAFYSGHAWDIENVTSMSLLWFLPSLLSIVFLYSVMSSLPRTAKIVFISLSLIVHPYLGLLSRQEQAHFPLGLIPALYVLPIGLLISYLFRNPIFTQYPRRLFLFFLVAHVIVKSLQISRGVETEIGFGMVGTIYVPLELLLNDMEAVTGVLLIASICMFTGNGFIESIGRYSLPIYLLHGFVFFGVAYLINKLQFNQEAFASFIVSFVLTVILTLMLSMFVTRTVLLSRFIFPKDWYMLRFFYKLKQ